MFLSKVWKFANQDIQSPKVIKTVQVLVGLTAGLVLYSLFWHLFMYLELNFLDGVCFFTYYNTTLWYLGEITIFLLSEILGVWITFKLIRSIKQRTTNKQKGFTLIELLIVIVIIAIISSIVMVSMSGSRQKAIDARALSNRRTARAYCAINPGESTVHGDTVYCDDYYNMWSITLDGGGTYQWKTSDTALPAYADGDCNNLTASDMEDYPACKACYDLEYAGFEEGWQLPTQGTGSIDSARDGIYCGPGRELWNLGYETCDWDPNQCDDSQDSCQPSYDTDAVAATYWSSTEYLATHTWYVTFINGTVSATNKTSARRVRCVLGQ